MTKLFQYTNYIDYDELINKPSINSVTVEGDKSLADYGIQPAGNYAHLVNGKVPLEELDDSILGNLQYQGVWDAEHNNPNLPLVPTKKGQYWIVSHGGERFDMEFETGDWIISGDSVWQKIDNSESVSSVNGKVGTVTLTSDDIPYNDTTVRQAIDGKQDTLIPGKNINIVGDVISAEFKDAIIDYNLTYNKPSINGVELIGYKTLEDFDIQKTIYAGENVYLTKSDQQLMNDTVNVYEATESRKGVSEIATQEETNTGTDDFRYITPKKLKPIRTGLETLISNEVTRATTVEGSLSNLTTDAKTNLVSAINEVDAHTDTNTTNLANHIADKSNPHEVTKAQVGLGNVDNTSDLNKPISTATQTALDLKANDSDLTAHKNNTSNPHSVTKAQVGLSNVDNTSDAAKPISTATQSALDLKANSATTLSGYGITDAYTKSEIDGKLTAAMHYKGTIATVADLENIQNPAVGDMYNVTETGSNYAYNGTDWDKLSETIDLSAYDNHIANTSNPHQVTKAQVGLGNVDNTSDLNKPISTATQTALDLKANDADLKAVAKSGAYSDLTGTPTKLSQFTNDTNYITSAQAPVQSVNGDTGTVVIQEIKNQRDNSMTKVWEGNQSQYDAITTKDSKTIYAVEGYDSIYEDLWDAIDTKQNKLVAGTNIAINGNIISNTLDISGKQDTITGAATTITSSDLTTNRVLISNGSGKVDVSAITSTELGYVSGVTSSIQTQLNGKQSTLTFDSTPTASSNNPVTSDGIKTAIDLKQDKVTGSSGEVLYHNGTNVFTQSLLNEGFVCMNAADVATCENNSPSFADVFATWKKFSHLNGENDAKPSEMSAWTYDSVNDTIVQPQNTTSYVGFISPKSYSSYDITVRCYSTGSDDDSMGLVAAFATDGNGREHTLSFIRTPGGTGTSTKWVCILDYTAFSLTATSYGQTIIVNKSSTTPTPSSTANWNTETIGVGTVINMTRSGNVITAACSQFNSTTVDENTRITIDLDTLSQTYPTLSLFKGSSPWGYSNCSQANSMYENIAVTDPDGYIFDVTNNQVLQYSASTRTWNVVSGVTPIEVIGAGRFSYNSTTGKLFYCTGTTILQIATNN